MKTTLPERLPWSMRAVKQFWVPFVLAPQVPLMILMLRSNSREQPQQVPANLCALIPTDLLARVVPAGKIEDVKADNTGTYNNTAECSAVTNTDEATTTARSSLWIRLTRHAGDSTRSPEKTAQNSFAITKAYRMNDSTSSERVFDISKLGDSAYLSIRDVSDFERRAQESRVEVSVWRKDIELTVHYFAAPTDEALSSSAAVAVARALTDALQ
jgi:hypothetical protein